MLLLPILLCLSYLAALALFIPFGSRLSLYGIILLRCWMPSRQMGRPCMHCCLRSGMACDRWVENRATPKSPSTLCDQTGQATTRLSESGISMRCVKSPLSKPQNTSAYPDQMSKGPFESIRWHIRDTSQEIHKNPCPDALYTIPYSSDFVQTSQPTGWDIMAAVAYQDHYWSPAHVLHHTNRDSGRRCGCDEAHYCHKSWPFGKLRAHVKLSPDSLERLTSK